MLELLQKTIRNVSLSLRNFKNANLKMFVYYRKTKQKLKPVLNSGNFVTPNT